MGLDRGPCLPEILPLTKHPSPPPRNVSALRTGGVSKGRKLYSVEGRCAPAEISTGRGERGKDNARAWGLQDPQGYGILALTVAEGSDIILHVGKLRLRCVE